MENCNSCKNCAFQIGWEACSLSPGTRGHDEYNGCGAFVPRGRYVEAKITLQDGSVIKGEWDGRYHFRPFIT
jgi:hypothetical protein